MDSKPITLSTERLLLVGVTVREALATINELPEEHRQQISDAWFEGLANAVEGEPWYPGFNISNRLTGELIGQCGFKGEPEDGQVEIAYMIEELHREQGFATEAAIAMSEFALGNSKVASVVAHTLPNRNASTRVLEKSGFAFVGEHTDPEDGLVWRWARTNDRIPPRQ